MGIQVVVQQAHQHKLLNDVSMPSFDNPAITTNCCPWLKQPLDNVTKSNASSWQTKAQEIESSFTSDLLDCHAAPASLLARQVCTETSNQIVYDITKKNEHFFVLFCSFFVNKNTYKKMLLIYNPQIKMYIFLN